MKPRYITVPEMKVVGLATKFISPISPDKNNMVVLPALWQKYMPRRHEIKNIFQPFNLGVCIDIPKDEQTHFAEMLYMAGTEVTSFDAIPEGMDTFTIPAGSYAVFNHKGRLENFEQTMQEVFGTWLPTSGKTLRDAPTVEFYDDRFKLNSDDSELDLWIPVVS